LIPVNARSAVTSFMQLVIAELPQREATTLT